MRAPSHGRGFEWGLIIQLTSFKLFIIAVLFGIPQNTHAGVFSFVSNLFAKEASAEVQDQSSKNSQTLPFLQPVPNSDPNPVKKEADIAIVDGSALQSAAGPSGTVLEIQEKEGSDRISIYQVRQGDTLSGIGEMFGVSPNTILWANNIKNARTIQAGDELVILPISGIKYTIKKGDTLAGIAKKFNGDETEIAIFNDLVNSTKLEAGTEIIIPDGEIGQPAPSKSSSVSVAAGGSLSSYFVRPVSWAKRTQGLHGSCACGVDLANSVGTPILAAAGGKVILSRAGGWNGGYGNYIVISHPNGTQTLYSHLSKNYVVAGQSVAKGEEIGAMGATGKSTGSHLHFEVRGGRNPF